MPPPLSWTDDVGSSGTLAPRLVTDRLILRALVEPDLRRLNGLRLRDDIAECVPSGLGIPTTMEDVVAGWQRHGFGSWAIHAKDTPRLIGTVGLHADGHSPCPEISWLLDPTWWGKGLATEAATAVLHHAFGTLQLQSVMSSCLVGNRRSERVMQKLGMRQVSGADDRGRPVVILYELRRDDWLSVG